MERVRFFGLILLGSLLAGSSLLAEEQPLAAGSEGVPVPKKTRDVRPKYPSDAAAQGIRGIVILDLVIGASGQVEEVSVVRSIPGLDEASIAAARQWQYQPVKVSGKPVRVRMTVPITFTLALPTLAREAGIPELRQGTAPLFPDSGDSGSATVSVTLDADGRVASANVDEGVEPWTGALVSALKNWRFSPPPDDAVLSFRVQASFTRGKGPQANTVALRAAGLVSADLLNAAHASASLTTTAPAAPAEKPNEPPPPQTPPPGAPQVPGSQPDSAPPPATPAVPPAPPMDPGTNAAGSPPQQTPTTPTPRPQPAPPTTPAAPDVEVITAPLPAPEPENGISAVRDVSLEPGVPELAKGRRPVSPPLARMANATGTVEVMFSVSAAGAPTVQKVTGPELLKKAAEQSVASWVFRRTRADRAYLVALFTYGDDKSSVVVRPQPAPEAPSAPAATATPTAPASAPATVAPPAPDATTATPAVVPPAAPAQPSRK